MRIAGRVQRAWLGLASLAAVLALWRSNRPTRQVARPTSGIDRSVLLVRHRLAETEFGPRPIELPSLGSSKR